jgi:hypothetical protein
MLWSPPVDLQPSSHRLSATFRLGLTLGVCVPTSTYIQHVFTTGKAFPPRLASQNASGEASTESIGREGGSLAGIVSIRWVSPPNAPVLMSGLCFGNKENGIVCLRAAVDEELERARVRARQALQNKRGYELGTGALSCH